MSHPAIAPGRVAVITGGASGIGLAAARKFAAAGMKIVLADLKGEALDRASSAICELAKGGKSDVRAVATDVGVMEDVQRLAVGIPQVRPGDGPGSPRPQRSPQNRRELLNGWTGAS